MGDKHHGFAHEGLAPDDLRKQKCGDADDLDVSGRGGKQLGSPDAGPTGKGEEHRNAVRQGRGTEVCCGDGDKGAAFRFSDESDRGGSLWRYACEL